ncbi:AAA family ATPase [Thermoplasmatales archaeon AK]|nr:AAA family ATPase [Thermoplasmatales archaeon AK]
MLITISGPIGSGKSTVGRIVAHELGFEFFSGGQIFRAAAAANGMTVEEFNLYSENHPEVDIHQDRMLKDYMLSHDRVVVESRLAGWICASNGIQSFRVYLDAPLKVRVRRVMEREGSTGGLEEMIKLREASEMKRYRHLYGVDYTDPSIYNLVIDTSDLNPREVADRIVSEFKKH